MPATQTEQVVEAAFCMVKVKVKVNVKVKVEVEGKQVEVSSSAWCPAAQLTHESCGEGGRMRTDGHEHGSSLTEPSYSSVMVTEVG